ncbi:MAG: hypothetical protein WEA04_03945 [Candidatus Andersenbacteria bacterium]
MANPEDCQKDGNSDNRDRASKIVSAKEAESKGGDEPGKAHDSQDYSPRDVPGGDNVGMSRGQIGHLAYLLDEGE